jgi:large conductance mechanosensitive channel
MSKLLKQTDDVEEILITSHQKDELLSFLKEFRDFAIQGNVLDQAVAFIISNAFKNIVDSLVKDILTPALGIIFRVDLSNLFVIIGPLPAPLRYQPEELFTYDELKKAEVSLFAYGHFLTLTINFILQAFAFFQIVKIANKFRLMQLNKSKPEDKSVVLLREIKDLISEHVEHHKKEKPVDVLRDIRDTLDEHVDRKKPVRTTPEKRSLSRRQRSTARPFSLEL